MVQVKAKSKGMVEVLGLISDIHSIMDLNWDNFISYQKVQEWGLNEKRNIEGVINLKILHSENHCRFLTAIPPLKSFNIHWHDCLEVCTVLAGTLADREKNEEYHIGAKCNYKAYEKHIPYNPSDREYLYLIVDFYK